MSKLAIFGGVLILVFGLIGAFGTVTFNGAVIENRVLAVFLSVTFIPLVVILLGFIFGGMRSALIAFFKETLSFVGGKKA